MKDIRTTDKVQLQFNETLFYRST